MALPLQATHLMGGEITVQHIGNDYVIAMLAYRDTIGVPMGPTVIFEISDTSGVIMTRTVAYDSTISGESSSAISIWGGNIPRRRYDPTHNARYV